jgi:glycosyltransferase involved in cell wall biosynthesis
MRGHVRIALLTDSFSKRMGYLESVLPKYLARLGAEAHVISMDLPPYYWVEGNSRTYGGFCEELRAGTVEVFNGYTLHVLAHRRMGRYMKMIGLCEKLRSIKPDVVQTMTPIGWVALDAAFYSAFLGYKLFTGCHTTASVFPLANQEFPWWHKKRLKCLVTRSLPGRSIALATERCYGATSDCADVAVRFFGIPKSKICVSPLGVDIEMFKAAMNQDDCQARADLRRRLGFSDNEIVCVYSGRFSEDKNPLLLAKAINHLAKNGEPFRGLFVGNGAQRLKIESCFGCVVHPFVPVQSLAGFFQAADVGVWPTQESISMLDAAACGLPIIANDTMAATERIDGNGLTYKLNDLEDLVRVLRVLRDPQIRRRLGACGARKMREDFSWEIIARQRLRDYQIALQMNGVTRPEHADRVTITGEPLRSRPESVD